MLPLPLRKTLSLNLFGICRIAATPKHWLTQCWEWLPANFHHGKSTSTGNPQAQFLIEYSIWAIFPSRTCHIYPQKQLNGPAQNLLYLGFGNLVRILLGKPYFRWASYQLTPVTQVNFGHLIGGPFITPCIREQWKETQVGWGYIADDILTSYIILHNYVYGDYLINHARRTPSLNKQDSMKSRAVFFFRDSSGKLIWMKLLEKILNSPSFAEVHVHSFLEVL